MLENKNMQNGKAISWKYSLYGTASCDTKIASLTSRSIPRDEIDFDYEHL